PKCLPTRYSFPWPVFPKSPKLLRSAALRKQLPREIRLPECAAVAKKVETWSLAEINSQNPAASFSGSALPTLGHGESAAQ
ncbi:hypothetical protein HispidOSU_016058, partial [Sigmodon hispidus]